MDFLRRDFSIGEVKRLLNYKYECVDNSLLHKYLLKSTFAGIQKFVPKNISPNLLTLCGFFSMLSSFLATFIFNRALGKSPALLTIFNMLCLLFYLITDGIDGVHARAINACSPLGYMLDHGVDSFCCLFIIFGLASTLSVGTGCMLLLYCLNICVIFYSAALQHKFTGVFTFNYISGCSEGIVIGIITHFVSLFTDIPSKIMNGEAKVFGIAISRSLVHSVLVILLLYNFFEFVFVTLRSSPRGKRIEFATALYKAGVIFILLILSFVSIRGKFTLGYWGLFTIFSCSFSTCYIEETLSVVLNSKVDSRIFIAYYILLSICFLSLNLMGEYGLVLSLDVCAAIGVFFIRAGYLIKNISKRSGIPFLTLRKNKK